MSKLRRRWLKYLNTEHWRKLREQAFKRDGYKCIKCGTDRQLRGHHKRYRKDLFRCTVKDIETLCEKCHEQHHREIRESRRKARRERKQTGLNGRIERLIWAFDAKR